MQFKRRATDDAPADARTQEARTPIIGRARELATLDSALAAVCEGATEFVALVGQPGIGKTFLLGEARRLAEVSGLASLEGRGTEFERELPYGLLVDALDGALGNGDGGWLDVFDEERLAELESVFPALVDRGGQLATGLPIERYRLHQAVRTVLEELALGRPTVLILDDVHWADDASVEWLAHLLRHRPEAPLLVIMSYRPHQAPRVLLQAVSSAARDGALRHLELGPLTEAEAACLLAERTGEDVAQLHRDSGGNPFYLDELAKIAGRSPRALDPSLALDEQVPAAVRAAIAEEVDEAPAEAVALLRAAAVAGEPFDLGLASAIAVMREDEALGALDALIRLELVQATDVPRSYVFRHPIVRRAVYLSAGDGFRLAAHARAAEELGARGASVTKRAHHLERSASAGDERAVALLIEAAESTASRAPASAARWYATALRLLPDSAGSDERLRVLGPLAAVLATTGQLQESRAVLTEALSLVAPEQAVARVRLVGTIARLDHMVGGHSEARELLLQPLASSPNARSAGRTALKIELAMEYLLSFDAAKMASYAADARDDAEALGEDLLEGTACALHALSQYYLGETVAARTSADRAARLLDRMTDLELAGRVEALAALGHAELGVERFAASVRHLDRGISICRDTGQGQWFVLLMCVKCVAHLWQGDLRSASAAAEAAMGSAELGEGPPRLWALTFRSWCWILQGDLDAALWTGEEAASVAERVPQTLFSWLAHCCLGRAQIEAGQAAIGRDRILAHGGGPELTAVDFSWRVHWYGILAAAELTLGDLDAAERWIRRAESSVAPIGLNGRFAEARLARASLHLARGNPSEAVEAARDAVRGFGLVSRRIDVARALVVEGRGLAASGERPVALERLESAHSELATCGAARSRDEVALELRRLGRHVARRSAHRTGTRGFASLTDRELEVAHLVSRGLKNREIAAQLFLSQKTVERHLARIFQKLDVSSRVAVIRAVERAPALGEQGE